MVSRVGAGALCGGPHDGSASCRMRAAAERQQAELEGRIEKMRASLADMSAAERGAQAVGKVHLRRPDVGAEGAVVPPTVPGGSEPRGLVRVNQEFFDRGGSPARVRVLFMSFLTNRADIGRRFTEVERQLNCNVLAEMVESRE